jgi:hypothetical protein
VIDESTLIKIYHSCHDNIERNFCLTALTSRHAPPDMAKTLAAIDRYMKEHRPNVFEPGREAKYIIPNVLDLGQHLLFNTGSLADADMDENMDQAVDEEDLAVECD